uniref:Uncharacterized protein n=1 Tax=Setaria italica TaxID=4555 RepID=K3XSB4_SETIT
MKDPQIILFNHLLQHQYNLMKYPAHQSVPLAPIQNAIHHMPGNVHVYNFDILPLPSTQGMHIFCQMISFSFSVSPIGATLAHMVVDIGVTKAPHAGATGSAMSSEMPSSAASSNHVPFTPSEIPGKHLGTTLYFADAMNVSQSDEEKP